MNNCNNMIVYLEQIKEIYAGKQENSNNGEGENAHDEKEVREDERIFILREGMIKAYNTDRIKTLNLLKAWKRFHKEDLEKGK